MKKENFKYLYSFKYNNKEYIYLMSKNYPFYFLEYNSNTNNFDYPDINTFKELYNKFYPNNYSLYFNKPLDSDKIKKTLENINIEVTPLIKTVSGLISLVLALSLCSCTKTNNTNNENNIKTTEYVEINDKNQEIYEYFNSYDMDITIKEYDGNNYIFVNNFINGNNKKQITLYDCNQFRKFKNINFIPSWDDISDAFKNNENIDNYYKKIILDSITNMKNSEELKDLDLSVLYANAMRMKFEYLSSEEMINTTGKDSVYAYFDTKTGIVYLPSDKPLKKFEFIHEVLGHGALAYREETKDSLIVFDCTNYIMLPEDNKYIGYSLGVSVSEGGANMIAHLATNDYSVSTFYELYEEELRVIADLCNVSIGELFNHKGISLYELMHKNNINTPVEYVFKSDALCNGKMYCEFSDLMERLFVDATEEKIINSNNEKQEQIINETVKIIKDSYFKDEEELRFNYDGGTINYNFAESADKYKENMDNLKSSK